MNRRRRALGAAGLVALIGLAYAGVLGSDFAYDDYRLIVRNEALAAPGAWLDAFRGDYYRSTLDVGGIGYYRPLSVVVNVLDRRLWGLDARGYHLTNLLLHAGVVLILWAWLRRLVGDPWALLAAALFALHPARAESVAFISGRVDVLAAVFYLTALLLLSRRRASGRRAADLGRVAAVAAVAAGAVLSKEMAVTLLIVAPLVVHRLSASRRQAAAATAAVAGAVIVAAVARSAALGGLTHHELAPLVTWPARISTTLGEYLWAMLLPGWSPRLEPALAVETWTPAAARGALVVAAAVLVIVRFWRRVPALSAGLLMALIALLPVSQLVPLETVWAERFTYIPAALAALAVAGAAGALAQRPGWRRPLVAGLAALVLIEAGALWHRNLAWRDDESLWEAVLATGQASAKAYNNRGVNLMDRGDLDGAAAAYRRALALDPGMASAHFNLGTVHWARGRLDSAFDEVQRAIALRDADLDFLQKLGSIASSAGRLDDAVAAYRRALALDPGQVQVLVELAAVERRRGGVGAALAADRRALELEPGSVPAMFGVALDHYLLGDDDACGRLCEEILAREPGHAGALFQRGRLRERTGDLVGALADYRASAARDSVSAAARVHEGRLLVELGRPCEAGVALAAAQRLAPPSQRATLERATRAAAAACEGR